ncbi:TPA: restriction endonuclease subunit S [Vibrio parahaemolyticus]|nr:restriction endonuclease subunit S [Vibrio parahaemolyticus]
MSEEVSLGSIASIRLGQNVKEAEPSSNTGIRLIRIKEVNAGYLKETSDLPFADIDSDKVKAWIEPDDILLPTRGLRMSAMLIQSTTEPLMTTNHIAIIKVMHDRILPEFCLWYLNSPEGQLALENQRKATTTVPQISNKDLMNVKIPMPSLVVQSKIVEMNSNWLKQEEIYKRLMLNGFELTQAACRKLVNGGF